jgi:hypothetical protein
MAERKEKLLRVDQELYDALARWAADDLRSVNAQIEFLLRESLRRAGRLPSDPTGAPLRGPETGARSTGAPPWGSPDPSGLRGSPDPSGPDPSGREPARSDG